MLSRVFSQLLTYGMANWVIDKPPKLYDGFSRSGTSRDTMFSKRLACTSRPSTNQDVGL
ncbi:hypothetical protein D3C86_1621880 [compost metagenome]